MIYDRLGPPTETGCTEYQGGRDPKGYGVAWNGQRLRRAHRLIWELTHGPIPDGMLVLHRCDNPPCCNIDHLFLGTARDNSRDMIAKGRGKAQFSEQTTCIHGHPFTERYGRRICVTCRTEASRRQSAKQKQARS